MDSKKIGKLIAELRRKNGLTQQQLGDIVGVGFRAVSKWERGITIPDISIINTISKVLGISSDELLNGELNNKVNNKIDDSKKAKFKNKLSRKTKIILTITLFLIIILAISLFMYFSNKKYTYNLYTTSNDYNVMGEVTIQKNKLSLIINKIQFADENFSKTKINSYEYYIIVDDKILYGCNSDVDTLLVKVIYTIQDFSEKVNINYNEKNKVIIKKIIKDGMTIKISFLTQDNQKIEKNLKLKIIMKEDTYIEKQ